MAVNEPGHAGRIRCYDLCCPLMAVGHALVRGSGRDTGRGKQGLTLLTGRRFFLGRAIELNPKSGELPVTDSANSRKMAFPASNCLSHEATLQNFLGLPEARLVSAP